MTHQQRMENPIQGKGMRSSNSKDLEIDLGDESRDIISKTEIDDQTISKVDPQQSKEQVSLDSQEETLEKNMSAQDR
eukprot:CAMPEP_0170505606 /NCGR_PEP_ID=MMETSP0208-20121228/51457_1 /TAXON_ID=197538 /ORGANISM="Strombidium inclinatum, Strain S3" /LENGTH=76 /DNA_ID=CAMNT_0010786567 /DNA_START=606 /DNA_END=836 /DNA_ORIENTATION=-